MDIIPSDGVRMTIEFYVEIVAVGHLNILPLDDGDRAV
jgi:hypothetical protein